ncbi:MAG: methyltransferase domain-containing protein, partial [Nannocystaceae bacterium]
PACRKPGDEALHMTLSQSVDDIEATLDWVYDNALFTPTEVILVSFSLQGVMGRRAVFRDRGRRIHYWLGVTGAPAAQEVIRNATGGIDYIAEYAATGKTVARAAVLGVEIEGMRFCEDLLRHGLAFMADAKREIAEIPIPVTWVLGLYDAWIDPGTIREFMAVKARAPRELLELECGHVPLNSDEALKLFSVIMQAIWRRLFDEDIEPVFPNLRNFLQTRNAEWRRIPKSPIPNKRNYWHEYLLGASDRRISYDVLNSADEYISFLDREADLLGLKPGHRMADMGCGTGNFFARLVERKGGRGRPLCRHLTLVDFVPTALEAAGKKLDRLADRYGEAVPRRDATCLNLELSPLRTVRAFLSGTYYGYDPLKGTIRGLTDYSIDMWKAVEDWRLHDIIRGRTIDDEDRWFLRENFPEDEQDVILEMNRLTRFLKGDWTPEDLTREGRMVAARGRAVNIEHLQFSRLDPVSNGTLEHLPFDDGQFERILSSLVLSYVNNPLETLREFHRCLAPGGRLVISSMRPDVDMSRIYRNLMMKLERGQGKLPEGMTRAVFVEEVRHYVNSAAFLLKLAEEGQFVFFSRDEMRRLVERAGFRRVEVFSSFGRPAQALITVGYR